jgi:hypothetical protein
MTFRVIAVGAAVLVGLAVAATPTRAPAEGAATASPTKLHPTTRVRAGRSHKTARAQHEGKPHHGKRSRVALARHRHRAAPERIATPPELPAVEQPEEPAAPRNTASARRFREFLSPQPFAVAVGEDLRRPRLLAAHLSGEIADPQVVAAAWTGAVETEPQEHAAPVIAHDEAAGEDSHSLPPALSHTEATELRRVVRAAVDNEPARMSFLRWFFVAWGGVLTFASALRLAVG